MIFNLYNINRPLHKKLTTRGSGIKSFLFNSIVCIFIIFISNSYSQVIRSHEIGLLWETMPATGSIDSYAPLQNQMTYPGGDFGRMTRKNLSGLGLWIGVTDWTDKQGTHHSHYVSEGGFENYEAPGYTFFLQNKKKVRYYLPTVMVNEIEDIRVLDSREASGLPVKSLIADERIQTSWGTDVGVQVEMTSYAFANQNHNSYIIREYTFKNNGNAATGTGTELSGQNLTGVYFGFIYHLIPGGDRGHQLVNQNDDWAVYYGSQPGDTLRGLYYVYDGVASDDHYTGDDTGDPDESTGEFLSPQYPGFGVIHADAAYNDDTDDRLQPSTVEIRPRDIMPSHTKGHGEIDLYSVLSTGVQSTGTVGKAIHPYDPEVIEPVGLLSFGPYDIPANESITIVLYQVVGSISQRLAISEGSKWIQGTLEFDGKTGDQAKNALLATGLDSLTLYASRAEWAWKNGLETVASPPPSPNLSLTSGFGENILKWTFEKDYYIEDWQTGVVDIAGYRVYRADGHYTKLYNLIADLDTTQHEYVDKDVVRGKNYYYYVTAYDDGSQNTSGVSPGQRLESSPFSNRNYSNPCIPNRAATKALDSVYVVPNPFHVQGKAFGHGTSYNDYYEAPRILEDKIMFVGLPAKATIRIFTMHGDLVTTLEHPNPQNTLSLPGSANEEFYNITDSWQIIKSGVYIYYVEGWDESGNALGSMTGKFVVIR